MKYSIVIPTYNHCDDLLKPCIESIFEYTDMTDVEIIVVANGCTDNTREYVEGLESVKMIWSDEALGYTKATNLGIKEATGEFVVLLNNDTLLLYQEKNKWLNQLVEPFSNSTVGLSGPLEMFDDYAASNVLIFFCVMIRKSLFDSIGILDEIFSPGGGEDIDFTVRAKQAGYKAVCICSSEYSYSAATNVGDFPIWHKDNKTFGEIPEYASHIIKRNGLINCKRYNKDIKLNLGSGGIHYPGFLSVDKYDKRSQVDMDITKLDFDDNSVSEIMAIHVFEHLNPYKTLDILKEWLRVLKPGAKLIMEMPDIERLCKKFVTAGYWQRFGILNAVYGSVNTTDVGDPGDITSPHLFGWWPESLYNHLAAAGYTDIQLMEEQVPHPEDNMRVEAIKPRTYPLQWLQNQHRYIYKEIIEDNEYKLSSSDFAGDVHVIDIGANIGMFSLYATYLGAKKVVAVEPVHKTYSVLVDNIKQSGYNTIVPFNYAVSSTSGQTIDININNDHGLSSQYIESGVKESAPTITLSELINLTNKENIVLKIDCEGAEYDILLNANDDDLSKVKTILIEIHGDTHPVYKGPRILYNKLHDWSFRQTHRSVIYNYHKDKDGNIIGTPTETTVEVWKKQ